jgi:hypothetical protein
MEYISDELEGSQIPIEYISLTDLEAVDMALQSPVEIIFEKVTIPTKLVSQADMLAVARNEDLKPFIDTFIVEYSAQISILKSKFPLLDTLCTLFHSLNNIFEISVKLESLMSTHPEIHIQQKNEVQFTKLKKLILLIIENIKDLLAESKVDLASLQTLFRSSTVECKLLVRSIRDKTIFMMNLGFALDTKASDSISNTFVELIEKSKELFQILNSDHQVIYSKIVDGLLKLQQGSFRLTLEQKNTLLEALFYCSHKNTAGLNLLAKLLESIRDFEYENNPDFYRHCAGLSFDALRILH